MSLTKAMASDVAAARDASGSAGTRALMRFGYVARGLIYLLPGVLALRLALRTGGAVITQNGAIRRVGHEPHGHVLLLVLASGLAGYALWGIVRAILDPLHEGHSALGVTKRLGYLTSALAYGGLLAGSLRAFQGALLHAGTPRDWTADLLSAPFGPWLVGIVGLCWIAGAGVVQIASGWTRSFARDLDLTRLRPGERALALRMGTVGLIARGVVFTIIGLFLIGAAIRDNPGEARGLDGALMALVHEPFGRALLALVAGGLVVFGLFSML